MIELLFFAGLLALWCGGYWYTLAASQVVDDMIYTYQTLSKPVRVLWFLIWPLVLVLLAAVIPIIYLHMKEGKR